MTSEEKEKCLYEEDEESPETMQKFLTEAGLYERGMNAKEMRDLVKLLKESKEMHEKRNSQCFQPPDSPAKNIIDNNNENPRTYANKVKNSSNNESTVENREIPSTESINIFGSRENASQQKKKLEEYQKRSLRRKKYDMDLLKAIIPDDEEPLAKPKIEDDESTDYWSNKEISIKQRVEEFSKLLEQLRDAWIMEKTDVAADSELEWGSPIEVDHRMFSSDKKMMTNKFELEPTRDSMREPLSRASKRKANTLIEHINNHSDSEPEANDDFDDDVDSALFKKRKPQQERRKGNANGSKMHIDIDIERVPDTQMPSTSFSLFDNEEKKKISDDDDNIFEFKEKEKHEEIYPRKIQPPTPSVNKARRGKPRGKTSFRGPRSKKTNESTANKAINEEDKFPPSNEKDSPPEIILDCEPAELLDISPQTNMKSLKMPLAEKTRLSKLKLKEIENIEKAKDEEEQINLQKIEDDKKKRQEELVKKRLAEREESEKLLKEREERDKSMQIKWNNVLHDKKKDRIKDNKNLSEDEIQQELFSDDIVICEDNLRTEQSTSSSTKGDDVECPICNRFFPKNDIANHASECNQFEIDETSSPIIGKRQKRNNTIEKLICSVCNRYSTMDASDFMEHVGICNEENRRQRNSNSSERDYQGNRTPERKNFNFRERR
ncbi:DNA ligase 1-like [Leptopilina heterotoma]|uniref:DNA ligase 1-like n=1 Tax=Leptopilina heterotoma TaxID=63436 RepID=UPI001CA9404E|nr:DNA ligase 1-like [Leptopilina heterotoma]